MCVPERQTGVAMLEITLDNTWNIGTPASSQALHHQAEGKYHQPHVRTGWNWFGMVMAWCYVMWNSQTRRWKGVLQVWASYAWSRVPWAYENAGPVSLVRLQAWDQRVPCYQAPWVSLGQVQVWKSFQKRQIFFLKKKPGLYFNQFDVWIYKLKVLETE